MDHRNGKDGRVSFTSVLNFRDVGQHINFLLKTSSSAKTTKSDHDLKQGVLYRSARPDSATPADRSILVDKLKIKTIIDLRTPTEHLEQAREAAPTTPTSPAVSSKHPTQAFHIPGIDYVDVNFNGSSYSDALIKQLTWSQTAKLYSLYILGYRKSAISVLGTNVMAARGLAGLAEDSLTHCQKEVKEVFDVLCDRSRYPVVVHCTQGKDRTGLIVLLVLMLCDVSLEAIEKDYQLSGKELEPERAERVEEIRSIGLPDSFADCEEGWARRVAEFVENRFGGVEGYLDGCGIGKEQRIALRDSLVER